jgi:hypothetical protein
MSYESIVYRILIASPSDVDEETEVAARVIQDWNDLNSFNKKIVLLPVRWETHSSPTYGVRPQEAINKQIVDECDLLIGFFWTKIGTPTGVDLSGTIEEIKRVSKAGKPVMIYFSKRGKDPSQIDLSQLEALNKFKEEIYQVALVENFTSIVDFRDKISRQLEMKIRELQERTESSKELISFSFIDKLTGELTKNIQEINVERVELNEKKIQEAVKNDKRVTEKRWLFQRSLHGYLNKKNNVPIILGIKNNTNRIFGNVIVELKVNSSMDNALVIQTIGSNGSSNVYGRLDEYNLTKENEEQIRRLFKENLTQTSSNVWEFSSKPFTLLPNKVKVMDIVLLLYPKATTNVEFGINLFSENILQLIESSCVLIINTKKRELTDEEINEIIEKTPDDDLPF